MRRAPSLKRLEEAFPGKGKDLRALIKGEKKTRDYASVRDLESRCWNQPGYVYRLMTALNEIIGGYGSEAIRKRGEVVAEYVNMGDCYNATLLYVVDSDTVRLTTVGDFINIACYGGPLD